MIVITFLFRVVRSGHQGQVFSTGRDVVGTLSVVAGFLMIVPTGNGWSLAQLIMLWGASIMGVGSANVMVDFISDRPVRRWSEERKAAVRRRNLEKRINRHAPLFADELIARELAERPDYFQGK